MTINDAEMRQNEFNSVLVALNNCIPRIRKYNEAKNSLLNNAKNFYKGRGKIIDGLKEGIFLLKSDDDDDDDDDDDESEQQQTSKKPTKDDVNAFNKWVNETEVGINRKLFENHFKIPKPSSMFKYLYKTNDREENNKLVSPINSGLQDLEEEIKEMSEEEREIGKCLVDYQFL